MPAPLLHLRDVRHTFGGPELLKGAELQVHAGARIALVGRNGSGKSTLLKIAAGLVEPTGGERIVQRGIGLRYLPQEPDLSGFATTLAYVEAGLGEHDDPHRARYLLERLGLTGAEDPARLSGGETRRAALARVLAPAPDVLMLDEPTNHLDLPGIAWLEQELAGLRSALVIISHDRRFLNALSRTTVWLDRGRCRTIDKGFSAFEATRDELLEQEEQELHKLDRQIAREEDWVVHGVSARRKRNQRRMAALQALRQERRERRRAVGQVNLSISEAEQSGKRVVEADRIAKSYMRPDGSELKVVRDFSVRILRGERIGLVGPNGAGKTTLINLLTAALPPDRGAIKLGVGLEMVTLDQGREDLDPKKPLKDALTRGHGDYVMVGGARRHVVGYMKDFLFTPQQAETPVAVLSGGERGRLMLARALALPSNVLVLDEPTNDLDLDTLDLLQEMIADYPGTVILVSHDRDFLDRTVNAVIAWEGDTHGPGAWAVYAGGYSDMVAQRGDGVTAKEADTAKPAKAKSAAAPEPRAASGAKKKLSFAQSHALKTLPAAMEKLHAEIARLREVIADPGLFARDPARFEATAQRLTAAEAELADAEHQWLELELLREEIGA
ncbi:MAG: ABC-F family ATP-binding cassette domain-containing protein [Rhodospirillaceae bacterium]|nr:ABC-F family ATP-binding cassette domain-containing protein [Rhodospirillaceae bacterium]